MQTLKNSPYSFYMMLAPLFANISNLGAQPATFFCVFIHRQILQRQKRTFWLGRKCLRLSRPSHHLPVSLPFLLFSHFFPPLLWVFIFISLRYECWRRRKCARRREGANETFIIEERRTKKEIGRIKKNWNVSHKNFPLSTFHSVFPFFGEAWEGQSVRSRKIIVRIQEMRIDTFYGIFFHFLQQQGNCSDENVGVGWTINSIVQVFYLIISDWKPIGFSIRFLLEASFEGIGDVLEIEMKSLWNCTRD